MDELDELDSIIDSISVNEPTPSDYVGSGDEDLEDILNDLANAEPAAYTPAPAPAPAPAPSTTTTTTNTSTTTSSTSAPRVSTLDFGIDDLETASASKPTITPPARKPTTTTNTTNTTTTSAYVSDPRISSLDFGIDLASSSSAPKSSPSASAPTQSFVATTKSNVSTTTPKPAPVTSTNVTPTATAGDDDLDNILSDLQDPSKKAKPSGPHPNAARGNRNCGKCGLNVALTERATEVEGIVYHSTCFTCTDCHAAITGTFLIIDGHPKCDGCAQKNKCAACNMALDGTILQQPDGSRKHARCANVSSCGKCGGALSSGSIVTAGEQKYHERCFVCTGCNAPLTQYVRVDGQNYCQPCGNKKTLPTCSVCRSQINGEYFQRNGQPLCVPCSKK